MKIDIDDAMLSGIVVQDLQRYHEIMKDNPEEDERIAKYAEKVRQNMKDGKLFCIGDWVRGKNFTEEHRATLSEKAKNRERMECLHCGKLVIPQMYSRWHGDKCKALGEKE